VTAFLSGLSFGAPWALAGLLALPVIWWLLRFTPPRPRALAFPPIAILLGLAAKQDTPDKTPWWLMALRLALAAVLIFAVSQPFVASGQMPGAKGPLLLIVDDGWAAAQHWDKRQVQMTAILEQARGSDITVVLAPTTPRLEASDFKAQAAGDALTRALALEPRALAPARLALLQKLKTAGVAAGSIVWLSDGLGEEGFGAALIKLFPGAAAVTYLPEERDLPVVVGSPRIAGSDVEVPVFKARTSVAKLVHVQLRASDGRVLADVPVGFDGNAAKAVVSLPIELRNEVQRVMVADQNHAGARFLLDDRFSRKTVALQTGVSAEAAQPLLSPAHFLTRALEPYAELTEPQSSGELQAQLDAGLSMLVLADIGVVPQEASAGIAKWVEQGGMLLRFAGPHLAAAQDDLMPVKLREGNRELGSALSWETPQGLQSMHASSPFADLSIDPSIRVSRQVLAEPDDLLGAKTWASLEDGTPLVTAEKRGKGLIVLFHVTANADWTNLPLSGTFVAMLRRLADMAPAAGSAAQENAGAAGDSQAAFQPRLMLAGNGELQTPEPDSRPIRPEDFETIAAGPDHMPGLYTRGPQTRAVNLQLTAKDLLAANASPSSVETLRYAPPARFAFAPYLFLLALGLFYADVLAALLLGGKLTRRKDAAAVAAALLMLALPLQPQRADAQEMDARALEASLETRLAFVKTGDARIDETSEQGLKGLGLVIADRTSAELAAPIGIDPAVDDLVFYPLIYWPVDTAATEISAVAQQKLNHYMRNGGTVFFDLRDGGDVTGAASEALKRLIGRLDIPPLEPVPANHVLTRSFYLLKDFPGRYADGTLWVEAQAQSSTDPGTADGVSAIMIGTNDYASAWALDATGRPLNALIPGTELQREYAFRVGVNVVMYALTGNYKADQVHIPALLERLGQ
jgi:Domain of unknown function (DUF4159)/Aerotolerance regulator N-terminal